MIAASNARSNSPCWIVTSKIEAYCGKIKISIELEKWNRVKNINNHRWEIENSENEKTM